MYEINRTLWLSLYAVSFAVMVALSLVFGVGWAWGTWALLFGAFVVVTEPSPRMYERKGRREIECDCPQCDRPE